MISVRTVESFLWLRYDSWLRSIKTLSDLFPGFEQLENGECSCWDCVLSSKNYGKTLYHSSQTHQPSFLKVLSDRDDSNNRGMQLFMFSLCNAAIFKLL